MANVNLLPWREAKRAENDKKLLTASFIFWGLCLLVGFLAFQNVSAQLTAQHARNQYIQGEISKLNRTIADIEKLQKEKQDLLGRIEVIQGLQHDRMQIVHVFDDIVRKLPAGVALDRMSKKSREIYLEGRAQSNSRVSDLMNQLNTSQWFGQSDLSVVSLNETKDTKLSEFELVVTERVQEAEDNNEDNNQGSKL